MLEGNLEDTEEKLAAANKRAEEAEQNFEDANR